MSERRWTAFAAVLAVAAAGAAGGCAGGGGDERSADAYCRAFYSKAAPIRQGYVDAAGSSEQNPLGALVKLLSAPGDLASIFDGMVDHAPDEIKSDTVVVRDSFKSMQSSMGKALSDPMGAIGDGLANSLSASGAVTRVDQYLNAHCPLSSDLAQEFIGKSSGG